jgi:hypothetical protein
VIQDPSGINGECRLLGCYGVWHFKNRSVLRLLVTANAVPNTPILVTLMMEAIRSAETSVLTSSTWWLL